MDTETAFLSYLLFGSLSIAAVSMSVLSHAPIGATSCSCPLMAFLIDD